MSFIKDFDELHVTYKSTFFTILALMPYYFVCIYLFNQPLIKKISANPLVDMDFWFIISLCFSLSLSWFIMNLILSLIISFIFDKWFNDDSSIEDIFKITVVYSIGYLGISVFLNNSFNFSLYDFILITYSFVIFRIIWGLIWGFILSKIDKN